MFDVKLAYKMKFLYHISIKLAGNADQTGCVRLLVDWYIVFMHTDANMVDPHKLGTERRGGSVGGG